MYYGLFIRVGHRIIRVDTTTGYTIDTARQRFAPLMIALEGKGFLRKLPAVKQVDERIADRRYVKTPW